MDSKGGRFPARVCCVAINTVGREVQCHMIRVVGSLIGGLMTTITNGRSIGVIPIRMTFAAFHIGMSEGEFETGMIECSGFPTRCGGMALFASGWELASNMVRIGRGIVISLVA